MSIGFVDFLLSSSIAVLGVLTGWFWRKAARVPDTDGSAAKQQMERAEIILARLHELAAGVAADVGEHNSQVEAINHQLSAESGDDAAVVVNAVSQLLAANSQMQQQLDSAQEQLRQQAQEIESQTVAARTDALTGLANRRVFDDEIDALTTRFNEHGTPFAVTILDIDHFKKFNDTHGHQVGDLVLQHAAKVYVDSVPETDIVTRFGGEEFAVIHPETTVEEAVVRADKIRAALDASIIQSEGKQLHVAASLGVAEVTPGEAGSELIERADGALYAAKEAGRNRTYWHDGTNHYPFEAQQPAVATQPTEETQSPKETPPAEEVQPKPPAPRKAADPAAANRAAVLQKSLLDRSAFLKKLSDSIATAKSGDAIPTTFLVRADRFDDHVDRHGSDTAEQLLDAIATVLLAVARKRGAVARFSRRDFAVLVSGYDPAQAMMMAQQIRKLSQQCPLPTSSGPIQFTLSIGTALADSNDDAASMIERAEAALDSAARAGGNCAFFHNGTWTETAETVLSEANCTP